MKSGNTFKSIGSVLGGMLAGALLSIGTDFILEGLHVFPAIGNGLFVSWMLAVALIYRGIYTVIGGYVTAMLAPQNPMKHVLILGIIGIVVSTIGTIAGWNLSAHWYPIALTLIALPCTWWGGKLRLRKMKRQ